MKIGLITIGQSPRGDVTPTLQAVLGPTVQLIEKSALDGLEKAEIEKLAPKSGKLCVGYTAEGWNIG